MLPRLVPCRRIVLVIFALFGLLLVIKTWGVSAKKYIVVVSKDSFVVGLMTIFNYLLASSGC